MADKQALRCIDRKPRADPEAACWAHARRKFFVLADIEAMPRARRPKARRPLVISPLALEAVRRIDELFNDRTRRSMVSTAEDGEKTYARNSARRCVVSSEAWMREERAKLSRHNDVAKAMDYMLKRWTVYALPR